MKETTKAKLILFIAAIWLISPDLIPGPIDDIIFMVLAVNKYREEKAIEG